MPDAVTTRSPVFKDDTSRACSFCRFICGRKSRKYIMMKIRMIGTNEASGFVPAGAGLDACAKRVSNMGSFYAERRRDDYSRPPRRALTEHEEQQIAREALLVLRSRMLTRQLGARSICGRDFP